MIVVFAKQMIINDPNQYNTGVALKDQTERTCQECNEVFYQTQFARYCRPCRAKKIK